MKKAVFITGAQSGTGFGIAQVFARSGWDVFITSRDGAAAAEAAGSLSREYGVFSKGYRCVIGNEQQVIDIFRDIDNTGRFVQAVVLNAADMGYGVDPAKGLDFFTQDIADFRRVFETNLVWNFMIVRQAALRMKEHHKGSVVFISSNTAYRAIPNRAAYSASKGGINSLSKCLAVDLGKYGIRSNVLLPGTIKTRRWAEMGSRQIVNGTLTPIGDISDFEDLGNAALFFAEDASKNITGAELVIDGGMSCQLYPEILNDLKRGVTENQTSEK